AFGLAVLEALASGLHVLHGSCPAVDDLPEDQVTGPAGPASLRAKGSFPVAWTNTTGTEVDVWLNAAAGRGRIQRLAMVSPRAGAGPAGEALVTLPEVPPGKAYALEVTAGNGAAHAFSRPFAVTD
ncbi:hypothetical protein ABT168_35615, partial [Streptomyces sp. NPDC001793]